MSAQTTAEVTPRPVICVVDHLYRDLQVARDARAGRFTQAGVRLDMGRRPDWHSTGLATDEEWRIDWVKHYQGLDLAHAFLVTGDAGYLDAWQDLVESFCAQVPVGHDRSEVSARRVQNWLYAWQRFANAPGYPGLRGGLAEQLVARIEADADHIAAHLTPERNHRTLELYTLLLVALALDQGHQRALDALAALAANALTDIWDDGVHRECSTDYHLLVTRSLVGGIANAREAGLPVPPALLDRAGRACDFALHVQRPDGITPAISDGDPGDFRPLLTLASQVLGRADLAWAASAGVTGTPPTRRLVSFPDGGYHVQRSGWGDGTTAYRDERFALLDCGPLGEGGHGHYDQLSVELFGGGHPLVVDPGRFTYADDEWRRWFKGTAAHNTVTVDGADQTPYRRGKPKGPTSVARLMNRRTGPGVDQLVCEVRSPSYEAVHTRSLTLVDDDYWVVHDRLRGTRPHRYEARWHLASGAYGRTTLTGNSEYVTVLAPGVSLVVPRRCGQVRLDAGWVSPEYGVRLPAPVVVVTADGRADADLVTALVPGPSSAAVRAMAALDRPSERRL